MESSDLTLILVALIGMAATLLTVALPLWVQMRRTRADATMAHTAAACAVTAVDDVKVLHEESLGLLRGIDRSVNQKEDHEPTIRENVAHAVSLITELNAGFSEHVESDRQALDQIRQNHVELLGIIAAAN